MKLSTPGGLGMLMTVFALLSAQQTTAQTAPAQKGRRGDPKETEVWEPAPKVMTPESTAPRLPRMRSFSSTVRTSMNGCRRGTSRRRNGSFATVCSW
jgi:hypothetical protein